MSSQNRKDLRSLLVAQALGMAVGGPYAVYLLWSKLAAESETNPIAVLLLCVASIFSSLLYIAFVFAFMVPAFSLFLESITEGEEDGSGGDIAANNRGTEERERGAAIQRVPGSSQLDTEGRVHSQDDEPGQAEGDAAARGAHGDRGIPIAEPSAT